MKNLQKIVITLTIIGMVVANFSPLIFNLKIVKAEEVEVVTKEKNKKAGKTKPSEYIIDIRTAPQFKTKSLKAFGTSKEQTAQITLPSSAQKSSGNERFTLGPLSKATRRSSDVIIDYYEGIEEHSIENLLHYFSRSQNEDGSFGRYNQYDLTGQIALVLDSFHKTDNDQFAAALDYLTETVPQNNREKAIKARLLGPDYNYLLDDLITQQNLNGSFGIDNYYMGDLETTLEVTAALYLADVYTDELNQALIYVLNQIPTDGSLAYFPDSEYDYYLINKTANYLYSFRFSEIEVSRETILVQEVIDRLLSFLASHYDTGQEKMIDSNNVVDELMTLFNFQLYEVESDKQALIQNQAAIKQRYDGSFGNSLYASVAAARSLTQPDLEIKSINSATSSLVNRQIATFEITLKNIGYAPISEMYLYDFIDKYQFSEGYNLSGFYIGPQEEEIIELIYSDYSTIHMIGDTELQFYIEGQDEFDYVNNWKTQNFEFASNPDGLPALQTYYIAQKYSDEGSAGINVRWAKKPDPNRSNYAILFRPISSSEWSVYSISNDLNGIFLTGFPEDVTYEVSAGTVNSSGEILYFGDTTPVTLSSDEDRYRGDVTGQLTIDDKPTGGMKIGGYNLKNPRTDQDGNFSADDIVNGSNAAWIDDVLAYEELITKFPVYSSGLTSDIRIFSRLKEDLTPPTITEFYIRGEEDYIMKNQREEKLFLQGIDDITTKEAAFYYFNPSNGTYNFIGTSSTVSDVAGYEWYIPADLLGPGYKVKAVLWDYAGNPSTPVEWGPFEITDGTLPSATVEIDGLVDGTWFLGTTNTITWDISSTSPVTELEAIQLHLESVVEGLASDYPSSPASFSYTMPSVPYYLSDSAYIILRMCDALENCSQSFSDTFVIAEALPVTDLDSDSYYSDVDCDDADPAEHPGVAWHLDKDSDEYWAEETTCSRGSMTVDDDLTAYWAFNEESGLTAYDASEYDSYGTIVNGTYTDGLSGTALEFDGNSGYVNVESSSTIEDIWAGGGSVSIWLYPHSGGEEKAGRVFAKTDGGSGWFSHCNGAPGSPLRFSFHKYFSGSDGGWRTGNEIPINEWTHLTIVYNDDNIDNDPTFYINGVESSSNIESSTPTGTADSDDGINLRIGNNRYDSRTFDGEMDEIRWYRDILTEEEINEIYSKSPAWHREGHDLGEDCDDTDRLEYPGITWHKDADNDSYYSLESLCQRGDEETVAWYSESHDLGLDCNDQEKSIHPGALEVCQDDVDQDCNGEDLLMCKCPLSEESPIMSAETEYLCPDDSLPQIYEPGELKPRKLQRLYDLTDPSSYEPLPTQEVDIESDLAGYWPLDEGEGTIAVDSSGLENSGIITNASYVEGAANTALEFDGLSGNVRVNDDPTLQNIFDNGGSVSFWMRLDSLGQSGNVRIFDKMGTAAYCFNEESGDAKLKFFHNFSGEDYWAETVERVIPLDGRWAFVTILYDSNSTYNQAMIFINGQKVSLYHSAPTGTRESAAGNDLFIGNIAGGGKTFDGIIDEFRIYNKILTGDEIQTLLYFPLQEELPLIKRLQTLVLDFWQEVWG